MFCNNSDFMFKRNFDDESDEEIDYIDDLFYSPYKKRKLEEEEVTAWTIVAVTANITTMIFRIKKKAPRQPNLIRNKEWWDRCYLDSASEEFKKQVRIQRETLDMSFTLQRKKLI